MGSYNCVLLRATAARAMLLILLQSCANFGTTAQSDICRQVDLSKCNSVFNNKERSTYEAYILRVADCCVVIKRFLDSGQCKCVKDSLQSLGLENSLPTLENRCMEAKESGFTSIDISELNLAVLDNCQANTPFALCVLLLFGCISS